VCRHIGRVCAGRAVRGTLPRGAALQSRGLHVWPEEEGPKQSGLPLTDKGEEGTRVILTDACLCLL